jgi:putative ABC transport system permease protein
VIVFLESLRLAFSSLRANPLRALLTILGIMIGVASVVALTSIGSGSTKAVEDRFSSFGTDTVTVQTSQFSSDSSPITQSDLKAIQDTPGVKSTVYTVDTNATVIYGTTTAMASVTGTFPRYKTINHLTIEAGSFFTQFDVDKALPVAVLGSTTVEDLGLSPLRAVGKTVNVGGVRFRIVGVLASQGGLSFSSTDSSILVPLSSIEGRLVAFHPDISQIRVKADPSAVDTFETAVETTLRTQHGLSGSDQNDFQITNASSISSAVSSSSKTLTKLMIAIAAISLVVGGIGVANVMLVTVRERTREIGVRRAVGATRRDIVMQFLIDAVVISLIGGVIGLAVGIIAAYGGGSLVSVTPVFSWTAVILALVVAIAVGVLAGIGPAAQASSVEPTNALRWE